MKRKIAKIIAVVLVFSFVLAFAACKKDDNDETTTSAATTAVVTDATNTGDETTAAGTTVEVTTVPGQTTTAGTTVPGQTTTAPATTAAAFTAPIGTDITKIVTAYNQYANATKAYKGTVKVVKSSGTNTLINTLKPDMKILRDKANEMLPNDYKAQPDVTFTNGSGTFVENGETKTTTLLKHLPRDADEKMSVLEPAGVKSASCVVSGSGCKITLTLKAETVSGLNGIPKYHAQCMDTLEMKDSDLEPFKLTGDPTVTYTDATTIICTVNANGLMTDIHISEPAQIKGTLAWSFVDLIDLDVTGTWKQDITLTY